MTPFTNFKVIVESVPGFETVADVAILSRSHSIKILFPSHRIAFEVFAKKFVSLTFLCFDSVEKNILVTLFLYCKEETELTDFKHTKWPWNLFLGICISVQS